MLRKAFRKGTSGSKDESKSPPQHTRDSTFLASYETSQLDLLLQPIQAFAECPPEDLNALLLYKLRACQYCFDFQNLDPRLHLAKDAKRTQLMELCDFIGSQKNIFNEHVLVEIVALIRTNIFRPLPPKISSALPGEDDDEVFYDPSWEHLQLVYEMTLRFVVSNDVDIAELAKYFDEKFLERFLLNFDSEDKREKDYLKTVLHRIYARLVNMRGTIRHLIRNVLFSFLHSTPEAYFYGIPEVLEVLGTIISGFCTPLKDEHVHLLEHIIIPLHKSKYCGNFHRQLLYCEVQFVEKNRDLAENVIRGLLKYWPTSNYVKEIQYISELEDILELTHATSFARVMVPLFTTLARSIRKPHFQVQERIFFLWHNEFIVSYIAKYIDEILPIFFPALYESANAHWNAGVHNLALNVMRIFNEMDQEVVNKTTKEYEDSKAQQEERSRQRRDRWSQLEALAK